MNIKDYVFYKFAYLYAAINMPSTELEAMNRASFELVITRSIGKVHYRYKTNTGLKRTGSFDEIEFKTWFDSLFVK